ncbi:DUF4411 family protein [Paraburkholderia domus]|uniref:DUF4411 family protein n=1 Tax=Paraburkholderia domus TaxID=2793075 RepID=UPI001B0239FB|nr:DUF4411 family protein [Paraburkholderia domus]CAE6856281.1 hypothetical protein R75483_07847 [Paraburkholderia domus]
MQSSARYLLDSDVLITAKNLHYNPNFCTNFWTWVGQGFQHGTVFSIDKVRDELLNGKTDDPLYEWASHFDQGGFFLNSLPSVAKWQQLANWAVSRVPAFQAAAQDKFLDVKSADAWLIAFAAHHPGYVIVTNEQSAPESRKAIKLPDAASAVGVVTMSLFDVLSRHAFGDFSFKT